MRRRRKSSKNSRPSHGLWKWALGAGFAFFFLLAVMGFISFRFWLASYLRSEGFQKMVNRKTTAYLKAEGSFMPLQPSGFSIYCDGFSAKGLPGAAFQEMRADQIRAEFNPYGLWNRAIEIDQLDLKRLEITIGPDTASPTTPAPASNVQNPESSFPSPPAVPTRATPEASPSAKAPEDRLARRELPNEGGSSFLPIPDHLDLRRAAIEETDLAWGRDEKSGEGLQKTRLVISPDGPAWNLDGLHGQLRLAGLPQLEVDRYKARLSIGNQPQLFITDSQLRYGENGVLNASGEIQFNQPASTDFRVNFSGISVTPFLPEDWRGKLKGDLLGEVKIAGLMGQKDSFSANGDLKLVSGELEALPILDQIALFTHTDRFRRLVLQKASTDFSWKDSKLTATNFRMESEGLLSIEGEFTVVNDQVDGQFQVGVTPTCLRLIPGAQSKVFTTERGGYLWAPMKLTGPVQHPSEDLSPRLVAAAVGEVIDTGGKVIEKGKEIINDLLNPVLK